jgi:hypothetical protein
MKSYELIKKAEKKKKKREKKYEKGPGAPFRPRTRTEPAAHLIIPEPVPSLLSLSTIVGPTCHHPPPAKIPKVTESETTEFLPSSILFISFLIRRLPRL